MTKSGLPAQQKAEVNSFRFLHVPCNFSYDTIDCNYVSIVYVLERYAEYYV
jgi:hypothetical protein